MTHIDAMLAWVLRRTGPEEDREGEEAAEASRPATEWQDELGGPHSSHHHNELRGIRANAAEKLAESIAALGRAGGADEGS